MKTLIKNGRIVTAVDDYRADILIEMAGFILPSEIRFWDRRIVAK
jgi:hypothetical protein